MHRALILAAVVLAAPIVENGSAQRSSRASRTAAHRAEAPVAKLGSGVDLSEYEDAEGVEIKTRDGVTLHASYFSPRKKTNLAPAAILVHDTGGDRGHLMDLGQRLWKAGFAVLALDLRGHGHSATKDLAWKRLDADGQKRLWALAVRDLEAASAWLRDQKDVHATNLNVVGHRAGCALATRHASRDENVRSVALLEPRPKELGIDVAGDLLDLGGLPTYIVSSKDKRQVAEGMIDEAHQATGSPYIDLMICSSKKEEHAPDKKTQSGVVKWMKDKAFPKRGRK